MKFCYHCGRVTAGEPLFCNFCGRSYDVKLCPRLHPNPRNAEACSQCGSRDLSTPQPKVPLWVPIVEFLISLVPGLILALLSALIVGSLVVALLRNPSLLLMVVLLGCALGVLWWVWAQLPAWFRRAVSRMLRRRREADRGRR